MANQVSLCGPPGTSTHSVLRGVTPGRAITTTVGAILPVRWSSQAVCGVRSSLSRFSGPPGKPARVSSTGKRSRLYFGLKYSGGR